MLGTGGTTPVRLPSLSQPELLTMWVELLVIAGVARAFGLAARRLGQPPVVGELLAGVVLGPSVLAKLWPQAGHQLVPGQAAAAAPLNALAWLGVTLLLVLAGFDTDLAIVRRLGRPAAWVAAGGLLLPFAAGIGVALAMPAGFMGHHASRTAFVLFVALALSISSLPVIAKILDELGYMRRNFGQLTVAVGMVNDLVGWLALGVVTAVGRASHLSLGAVALPVVAMVVILGLSAAVGQRAVDGALRRVRRTGTHVDAVAVVLIVTFALAAATQAAHSDGVLGAYVAGILVGRSRFFQRGVRQHLETVTMSVLAPLFFATAGLRIDLASLGRPEAGLWAAVIVVVAVAAKTVGAYGGGRVARLPRREGVALAVGLNCRGAVEVVIATVGLSIGVLDATAYTAIVLMAIVTSVAAPPLLRLVVRDWKGDDEEQRRLQREETMARNLLVRPGRLLVPSRGRPDDVVAAELLQAVWPPEVAATVLAVDRPPDDPGQQAVAAAFAGRAVEVRALEGDPLEAIVEESRLGYSVLGFGTVGEAEGPLSALALGLLAEAALPVVLVRLPPPAPGADPAPAVAAATAVADPPRLVTRFRRILVPVAGSPASRTAEELAFHLAAATDVPVVLTHVVRALAGDRGPAANPDPVELAASGVVRQAVAHAGEHDLPVRASVREGEAPGDEIVSESTAGQADLVVLGTTIRRLDGQVFLGHTVEHVLLAAPGTVVVVATPDALVTGGLTERFDAPA